MNEGFVDEGEFVPADTETTELSQPSDGSLDGPTVAPQTRRLRFVLLWDDRFDAARRQQMEQVARRVAGIGSHPPWAIEGSSWQASDLGKLEQHQRHDLADIVLIRRGEYHRQRNTFAAGHYVQFTAAATAFRWVGARFSPPSGALYKPPSISTSARSSLPAARSLVSS